MPKRLIALLTAAVMLLSLAACGQTGDTQTLTKGKEFEVWREHYALPYILTFYMYPEHYFDMQTYTVDLSTSIDNNFYYLAYYTLLSEGADVEAIHDERENWEGDPETYLDRHALPADLLEGTMASLLGLTDTQKRELYMSDLYDPGSNTYRFYPPVEYDADSGKLNYLGSAALKEVTVDRSVAPAVATLTLEETYESGAPTYINRVTYREVGDIWQLHTAESYYMQNSFVTVSGGLQLDTLSGLSAADVDQRFRYSITTHSGILLLLANWEIEGYDLIHVDRDGSVIATGQIPDAMNSFAEPTLYTMGSDLYITIENVAYVGDLSLSRFTRYEMSYSPAAGEPRSSVICPDLTTWYYTGRDGIYQYNADGDEHLAFATHPAPPLEEDHGMTGQVYRTLYLAQDGDFLVSTVVGYEWISDVHVFSIAPGEAVTATSLDIGWGYGGSGYGGASHFAYHNAGAYDDADQSFALRSGWYLYLTGQEFILDPADIESIGGSESYVIHTNTNGDAFAFVTIDPTSSGSRYNVAKAAISMWSDMSLKTVLTIDNASPKVLGIFDSGEVLISYNAYGHAGFAIA